MNTLKYPKYSGMDKTKQIISLKNHYHPDFLEIGTLKLIQKKIMKHGKKMWQPFNQALKILGDT